MFRDLLFIVLFVKAAFTMHKQLSLDQSQPIRVDDREGHDEDPDLAFFERTASLPPATIMSSRSFKLGKQQYLMIPYYLSPLATNAGSTQSHIYKFVDGSLHKYQRLQSHFGYTSAVFEVAGNVFLAVGNYHSSRSIIYRLRGHKFFHFQDISARIVTDVEHVHLDGHHYLVLACYYSSQPVMIYWWNNNKFELYETIQISGARDVEHFEINNDHYLAVAVFRVGSNYNTNSYIYKWTGVHFVLSQTFPTKAALKFSFTRIGKMSFLAVSNMYDNVRESYHTPSIVYKWNGNTFEDFRVLNTTAAHSVTFVNIRRHSYLIVGCIRGNGISVYRVEGSGFHLYQTIENINATFTDIFQHNNRTYMFVSGGLFETRGVSSVYEWMES